MGERVVVAADVDRLLLGLIAESSPDLNTVSTLDGVYRYVSTASLALFGWEPADLVGQHQDAFVHPDDVALVDEARRGAARDAPGAVTTVCRFRTAGGQYCWAEVVTRLVEAEDERLIAAAVRSIGDRKKSEIDLRRQASTDPLTGVANRTVFMDRLQQGLRRLERQDGLVAVLFLDLDRFKLINDSVGHLVGDAVLLQMAERLRHFLRPQDTLARLGGDEFAIVIEGISRAEEAVMLGTRIIEAGRAPFEVGDEQFVCTTSVGIAVTPDSTRSPEGLLQEADLALYRAKDRGRDRAEVFDEELRTRAVGGWVPSEWCAERSTRTGYACTTKASSISVPAAPSRPRRWSVCGTRTSLISSLPSRSSALLRREASCPPWTSGYWRKPWTRQRRGASCSLVPASRASPSTSLLDTWPTRGSPKR